MQWYEIAVPLPLSLLESTYNFLWLYVNGLSVEKQEHGFLIRAYLYSASPDSILKKLNNFLHIRSKTVQVKYSPPSVNPTESLSTGNFVIVPTPTAYIPSFGIPIFVQRGRAFGIGSHPCTIYYLKALQDIATCEAARIRNLKILDAGTGTGILAIAAVKLGASDITGIEISLESVQEAQENVRANDLSSGIQIHHCSVTAIQGQFDSILANLYGPLLLTFTSVLIPLLSAGGWLVLGGMNVPHDEVVISAYANQGFIETIRYRDEMWSTAVLQKIESQGDF